MNLLSFFDHISISKKLGIFLLIPLVTLSFFASNSILDKQQQLRGTQNTLHFAHLVNQFSELAYSLQKERGLSAGVFGSKGKMYLDELSAQQQITDSVSSHVKQQLIKKPSYLSLKIQKQIDTLITDLDGIATTRINVRQHSKNDFFGFYSQLIDQLLTIISFMPSLNSTYELNNLAASYIELLWLEELSGQERGALNGVFSVQEFNAEHFSTISSYISGQQASIRNFNNLATVQHKALLKEALSHQSNDNVQHSREIVFNRALRQDALNGLQELIGYGGLIHDFKDHVIRRNLRHAKRYQENFKKVHAQIDSYRQLPKINREEISALNTIEDTFKQYQSQLEHITELKGQNLSIRYIDKVIEIDDAPAIAAINFLRHNISSTDPQFWWEQSTQRLDLIHGLSASIAQDLSHLALKIESRTQQILNAYILVFLVVLLLAIIIGLKLRARLVGEIKLFANSMRLSEQSHTYSYLRITGNDEISDLAAAFNSLIADRNENEESLRQAACVFSDTHEGIIITDDKGIIIDVNPTFTELTGYQPEDIIGKNPNILNSGHHDNEFYDDMWREIQVNKFWQGEMWNRKKNGELYAEFITITAIENDEGQLLRYIGIFSDVTQNKQQQEKLHLMAHYDALTQLPNRSLFADRFGQALAHSKRNDKPLAICFLDLDNFKPINDNFGHKVGDQLLLEVANRITSTIREGDTVSRQGGDEFAILLNDIDSVSHCNELLKRLHSVLARPYIIDGIVHTTISASSGATIYPTDDSDLDTLLRHADQAMYSAKQSGKNHHHFFNVQEDQQIIEKNLRLEEIEHALENNEFTLYYQPKVNMITGVVFGAEALIRWLHPEKGLIPPLDFLPIITGTELEIHIGNWVINQALSQLENWKKQGITLEVSVNIASDHLQSDSFFSELDHALEKHSSVNSKHFQLEILESSALGDLNSISSIIKTCQNALGVNIALDDFGTGYSSLTHLRNLSANTIKIDQSFIRDMLDDPSDYAIIDGVIGLSNSFNRHVIAEGVESIEHGLMLLLMGCELAQGYVISAPIPASDFPHWLKEYEPIEQWLHSGSLQMSKRDKRTNIFKIVSEHWLARFIEIVQSPDENTHAWPVMTDKHDHCGQWIKREKQERVFSQEGLDKLDKAHLDFHTIAHSIQVQHQNGDAKSTSKKVEQLHEAFDKMNKALEQCK